MSALPQAGARGRRRARRWDAVVVGSSLPGLVAAVRIARSGLRVLVIEEEAAADLAPPVREPFLLPAGGILGEMLRELAVPLIDQRRLQPDPVAYQVILPDARVDVGAPVRTAQELVTWGLAKPDVAQQVLRAIARSAGAEGDALHESPVVRGAGGRRRGRSAPAMRHARGMPAEVRDAPAPLQPWIAAQLRALANLGGADPSPEAGVRLLGTAFEGALAFEDGRYSLRGLLLDRIRALHGEFRRIARGFALVSVDGEPGVAPAHASELWTGRVLLLNAPRGGLVAALRAAEATVPSFLEPAPARRRRTVHLVAPKAVLPEGMARRLILVRDPAAPLAGTGLIRVGVFPCARDPERVDLVASALLPLDEPDPAAREAEIREALEALMPFSQGRLEARPVATPTWDDEGRLSDPRPGSGWPAEVDIRLVARPPIAELPRSAVGGLGLEGDLLLGWRAGDRLVADLGR